MAIAKSSKLGMASDVTGGVLALLLVVILV